MGAARPSFRNGREAADVTAEPVQSPRPVSSDHWKWTLETGVGFSSPNLRRIGVEELNRRSNRAYCTLAATVALPVIVNVQVLVLSPPLEQAPDQMASRPFVTLNVIDVLAAKLAEPVLPTGTLMPAGLDVTRSPLRPVAVTVSVALAAGGFTVTVADRVTPL
jgi:hypothetical protein